MPNIMGSILRFEVGCAISAANSRVTHYADRRTHRPTERSWQYHNASKVDSKYVVPYWEWRRLMTLYALYARPTRRT